MVKTIKLARVAAIAAAFFMSLAIAGPAFAQTLPEVTFAEPGRTTAEWPIYLALDRGFFKDEGITFTLIDADGPTNVANQVATGAVNMAGEGTDNEIAAISRGLPIKIVSATFIPNPYSLITLASVNSWNDLKGKTIMLGTKQDVTAMAFASLAAQHGLKIDDFNILIAGNSALRLAALTSGNAQGTMLTQPLDMLAEEKGMKHLGSASDTMKDWLYTAVAVNDAWAKANPQLVVKVLRALKKAVAYGYTHKTETVASLVTITKIDAADAAKAYDLSWTKMHAFDPSLKVPPAGINAVSEAQLQFGAIKAVPPLATLYDPSYVTAR